jgi:Lipocalin-like domain
MGRRGELAGEGLLVVPSRRAPAALAEARGGASRDERRGRDRRALWPDGREGLECARELAQNVPEQTSTGLGKCTPLKRTSPIAETYDFRGESVIHHVELSLFPNWVGVDQERLVEVRANRLTSSTRPTLFDGIQQTATRLGRV